MPEFNFIILYVDNPTTSAAFYANLLGRPPVEQSPTFAMLPLREGVMLGLWSRQTVEPKPDSLCGASEVAFTVSSPDEVIATHVDWSARGIKIAQAPVQMDFGRTFTALDPDGHRLRVLASMP
jgi:catechol 2,3-dioxygenase-like lactoylglutathione lyase family enzyme